MPSKTRTKSKRKAAKAQAKEDHQNTSAVFRIKPLSCNRAQIKYKGWVTDQQKLGDEIIELDEVVHPEPEIVGKHAIPIKQIGDYDMLGRIYRSNIVGSYIVNESNYPVLFLTVEYARSIATGSLLQIYLSIRMDKDYKDEINKSKKYEQYKNLHFGGTWNLSMECDPELKELWREKITETLKEDALLEFHSDYETNEEKQSMTTDGILEWIDGRVNDEIKWYEAVMEEREFKFRTVNRTKNYFVEFAQDPRFYKLLDVAMYCRVLNRRNEQNIDDDTYDIPDPDKVVNMNNVRQQMMENDELVMSDSSDSSDSSDGSNDSDETE
jgi:hypothetical protein